MALFAGSGGTDREPDDAVGSGGVLELLHITRAVVFDDKGAAVVDPFQDDGFAFEVGKTVGLAGGVGEGEVRGGLSDFRGGVEE